MIFSSVFCFEGGCGGCGSVAYGAPGPAQGHSVDETTSGEDPVTEQL
jgi:hypothetical protein